VYVLTSLTSDALSPASVRNEIALSTNTKVFALARTTRDIREELHSFYITKASVVRLFDYIEQVHKVSGVKLKVQGISETAEARQNRAARSQDDDEDEPKSANAETAGPQKIEPKGLSSVIVQVELEGEKQKIFRTIEILESLPIISSVTSVSMRRRGSAEAGSDEWLANLSLTAPALPEVTSTNQ
jgi:hypothetical protein